MIKKNNRKYYEPPRINEVKLEIDEAVLAACKTANAGGTVGKSASPCKTPKCKSTLGS